MQYDIPVVLITFIRYDKTLETFNKIRKVKPKKIYFVSDGPRDKNDEVKVNDCRKIADMVDWNCECVKLFSKKNLGCKKRVVTALDYVFEIEDSAVILEDDCVPTEEFFYFMKWGLDYYKNNEEIGIISGSNLVDYKYSLSNELNGYSMFINCWGWSTWRRTWEKYDEFLSIYAINKDKVIENNSNLNFCEKLYWKQIIKNAIMSNTVWDFYLQYTFFCYDLKSVYPSKNLVENIGFSEDSTHMKDLPEYVEKSRPQNLIGFTELKINENLRLDIKRDKFVLKTLYGYNLLSLIKLYVGNILRYLGIIKI